MSQPKSNEELVEEIIDYDENVGWVCYSDDVLKLLAQKDKEVAEAVKQKEHATLDWLDLILSYKHPDEVRRLIKNKLRELNTPKE